MKYTYCSVLNMLIFIEALSLVFVVKRKTGHNHLHSIFRIYLVFVALSAFVQFQLCTSETMERFLALKRLAVFPLLEIIAQCLLLIAYVSQDKRVGRWLSWSMLPISVLIYFFYLNHLLPEGAIRSAYGWSSVYSTADLGSLAVLLIVTTILELGLAGFFVSRRLIRGGDPKDVGAWLFLFSFLIVAFFRIFAELVNRKFHLLPVPLRGTDIYLIVNILLYLSIERYDSLDPHLEVVTSRVADTIKDGLVLTDVKGSITYVNPAFLGMTGLGEAKVKGKNIGSLFLEVEGAETSVSFFGAESSKSIDFGQRMLYSEDGDRGLFVDVRGTAIYSRSKRKLGLVYIVRDISTEKREEARRHHIVNSMQHDLKSSLVMLVQLVEAQNAERSTGRDVLDRSIAVGLSDMLLRLNSFLLADRMEVGNYRIEPGKADLRALLSDAAAFSMVAMKTKKVDFCIEPLKEDGEKVEIDTDPFLLSVVFRSLVSNAAQASPVGTIIRAEILESPTDVEVSIHNEGVIAEDVKKDFLRTYTKSKHGSGHGIGAFGARFITEELGGTMSFRSSEKDGTMITVGLPRNLPLKISSLRS